MTTTKHATEYQASGWVRELTTKSLAEANRQIASARNATPEEIRSAFRSQIRSARGGQSGQFGYEWIWCIR
jgi:hypothetical protein